MQSAFYSWSIPRFTLLWCWQYKILMSHQQTTECIIVSMLGLINERKLILVWRKSLQFLFFASFFFDVAVIVSVWHSDTSPASNAMLQAFAKKLTTSGLENLDLEFNCTCTWLFLSFFFVCFWASLFQKAENNSGKLETPHSTVKSEKFMQT